MIAIILVGYIIVFLIGITLGWQACTVYVDKILQNAIDELEEMQGEHSKE